MIAGEEHFDLTCGQRWLLYLLEQAPDLARPVQRIYRLSDGFDPSAFLEALECAIASNPALRLRLVQDRNEWKQYFPEQEADVSGEEIQGRTPEMRVAYAGMLIGEEAKTIIDLVSELPVRAKIIRVNGDHLLSLCVDHIAADEIAFDLFERALLLYYRQVISDLPVSPVLSDAFYRYISKEAAQKDAEHSNLLYWQQQLKDAPMYGAAGNEISWVPATVLNYQLIGQPFQLLLDFCRVHRCSLFNVIVAAQLLLIADTGNVDDIILNIPVSNRARTEERSIIANLSMLLHIRFTVINGEPVSRFVIRVRDQLLTAMAHRQYDYASLSKFVAAEAQGRGFHTGWLLGCNFVADNDPVIFPNVLFAERLDNLPGRLYDIPRTSFTVAARQAGPVLRIDIDWDAGTWPIASGDMEAKLSAVLQRFMDELNG